MEKYKYILDIMLIMHLRKFGYVFVITIDSGEDIKKICDILDDYYKHFGFNEVILQLRQDRDIVGVFNNEIDVGEAVLKERFDVDENGEVQLSYIIHDKDGSWAYPLIYIGGDYYGSES